MIEHITHGEKTLAIILRTGFCKDGIEFFTPPEFSQQLAYMKRGKGYAIPPHVHNPVPREVRFTHEVLFLKSGKVRVDFYEHGDAYLESRVLGPGDVILLCDGGHGFAMLEESEIIEVKQGPYAGEDDKRRFEAVDEACVRLEGC
jgi:mannose-6-phosphate isomerase-like protein (cupin superfamily)